jgi:hypothetical protein
MTREQAAYAAAVLRTPMTGLWPDETARVREQRAELSAAVRAKRASGVNLTDVEIEREVRAAWLGEYVNGLGG